MIGSREWINLSNGKLSFKEKSQIKNAEMFGLNPNKILREIVLPQVFKKIKSNLQNDSITIIKNTAVVGTIGFLDFSKQAQRIIDFTSGSCFAISGNLQKISHYIFIITPASVDISGDFQEILSGSFDVSVNNGL